MEENGGKWGKVGGNGGERERNGATKWGYGGLVWENCHYIFYGTETCLQFADATSPRCPSMA